MPRPSIFIFLSVVSLALGDCTQEACPALQCEHGKLLDSRGCTTCACAPDPAMCRCGQQCKLAGDAGTCNSEGRCVAERPACPPECPDMMCAMFCADGYATGADGCPTCACKKPTQQCPCGRSCEMATGGKGVCQTDNATCAVNIVAPRCNTCSNLLCRMFCEYGNVVDANGCQLCACNPNPNPLTCPCGTSCQMENKMMGVCSPDEVTCVDPRTVAGTSLCGPKCPEMMCMVYCPFGSVVDANGCPTCSCNPDPTPCVCGRSCALSASAKGVCQQDGTCGSIGALERLPCAPVCEGMMMCKMYCPNGNVIGPDGCPSCQCNPAPVVETCKCGESCKSSGAVGVCQADGTCNALVLARPECKTICPQMMCMMYCEHGAMMDEVTRCPTCKCNPPPMACKCGQPCFSARGNGTCQADGLTCAPLALAPKCDGIQCPAVKCALYCPNGNARDDNGCLSCRCNPAPVGSCRCGERCKQTTGEVGICLQDGMTCGPVDKQGVLCEKKCPSLMCNLFCPSGNALDQNGCATCACLPDKQHCKCGETCWRGGVAGMCAADGTCGPLTMMVSMCFNHECPAVRCMMFCPAGNEIDSNGCPSCRCKTPPPCPCGAKCALGPSTTGICSADGVCGGSEVAPTCASCPAQMCMMFCPGGNVIDANGCSTCRCLNERCPCGDMCKTADGNAGVCKADGVCVTKESGLFAEKECTTQECPQMKCMHYCPRGNKIDEKGCPSCECKVDPDPLPCPCGTPCATGVCQEDGKTCAVNIKAPVCKAIQCPKVMCMMFCPNGHAVDENGCPSCKCNPVTKPCPCGQSCTMEGGGSGVCQTDGLTCAVNIMAPKCFSALAAKTCVPKTCTEFCESGTVVDEDDCPSCECQPRCPCGTTCDLGEGRVGGCQDDGASCVERSAMKTCLAAATNAPAAENADSSSSTGVVAAIVIIALLLAVTVGLFLCRRTQRKVALEHNYGDLNPASGYVAPVAVPV